MSDLRKAAEMALEALEWNYGTDLENIENCMAWLDKMNATIPALRQALAQPEQEPVAYVTIEPAIDGDWRKCPSIKWFNKPTDGPLYTAPPALAQPEQEPVAWVYNGILHEFDPSEFATSEVTPLYTASLKREWVGLTEEEIEECKINGGLPHAINWRLSVKVMEAKLKEKNT